VYKFILLISCLLFWVNVGCETDLTRTTKKDTKKDDSSQSTETVLENDQLDLGSAEVVGYLVSLSDSYSLQYHIDQDMNQDTVEPTIEDDDYTLFNLMRYTHCQYSTFDEEAGEQKILKTTKLDENKECHLTKLPESVGGILTYFNAKTGYKMDVIIPVTREEEITICDPPSRIDQIQTNIYREKVSKMISYFRGSGIKLPMEILMDPSEILVDVVDESMFEGENDDDMANNIEAFALSYAAAGKEEIKSLITNYDFNQDNMDELSGIIKQKAQLYYDEMQTLRTEFGDELAKAGGSNTWDEDKQMQIAFKMAALKSEMGVKKQDLIVERHLMTYDELDLLTHDVREKKDFTFIHALDSSVSEDDFADMDLDDNDVFTQFLRPPSEQIFSQIDKIQKAKREIEDLYSGDEADVIDAKEKSLKELSVMQAELSSIDNLNSLKSLLQGNVVDKMVLKVEQDAIKKVAGGLDLLSLREKLINIKDDYSDDFGTMESKVDTLLSNHLVGITDPKQKEAILRSLNNMNLMEEEQKKKMTEQEKSNFDFDAVLSQSQSMSFEELNTDMETLSSVTIDCKEIQIPEQCMLYGYTLSVNNDGCPVYNCKTQEEVLDACPELPSEDKFQEEYCGDREVDIVILPNGCESLYCVTPF